jgi:steroid delta-isomerase-like uncharacterized protein
MAPATALSPQALADAAKAPFLAFNERDWTKAKASMTPDFGYDEVATGRETTGADATIELWKGWAAAFPDSKGTIHNTHLAGNNVVVLELSWKGTHKGPLQTPGGAIPATGKTIDVRACAVVEIGGDRARRQRHYFDMATLLRQIGVAG